MRAVKDAESRGGISIQEKNRHIATNHILLSSRQLLAPRQNSAPNVNIPGGGRTKCGGKQYAASKYVLAHQCEKRLQAVLTVEKDVTS